RSFSLPAVGVQGFEYSPADQPFLLEIWVEKTTMDDVLEPLCRGLSINLVPGAGFQSITSAVNLLQRVARFKDSRKPCRVFYISDFDPAGDQMPVAVARQLQFWRAGHVHPGERQVCAGGRAPGGADGVRPPAPRRQGAPRGRAVFGGAWGGGGGMRVPCGAFPPGRLAGVCPRLPPPSPSPTACPPP